MPKKPTLAAAMNQAVAAGRSALATEPERPPSRKDKRMIAGFFDSAVWKQLRQLALDRDTTVQQLLREALNELFAKYKLPRIA